MAYAVVGLAWIVVSDFVVRRYAGPVSSTLETLKGLAFVLVTAAAMYLLLMKRRVVRAADLDELERHAAETEQLARSLDEVRAAQTALAQSEARLRHLIDASLDAIVTVAADDLVLEWNEEAERLFGWTRAEAIGEELADLIVPATRRERYLEAMKRFSVRGTAPVRFETVAVDRTAREVPIELTVAPVEWGDQIVVTIFIRDISDRVRAAQEAQLIEAVVNAAPFSIIGVDDAGQILSWNPAAEQMYGWSADELRNASISVLLSEDSDDLATLLERVRLGVKMEGEQAHHVRRDGRIITVIRTLAPLPPIDGARRTALISVDLSEREMLERRLSDAEYLASLGRLAGTVAHEFNNVLMGIQSFADVIARRAGEEESLIRAASQIRLSIQRGRRITEDILRFTRAAVAPALHAINLDEWLTTIAPELQELVAPHVTITIEHPAPGLQAIGDPGQLFQVLANLALNAKDAMPRGGEIRITATAEPAPGGPGREIFADIRVSDSGVGMDAETAAHAFEPLFTTKKRGGTGLGLAVVQKIVRAHGGVVTFESGVDSGTTFHIRIPARYGEPRPESPVTADRDFAPRRILLVEDDVAVASGLADVLRSYDMTVDVLHSGIHVVQAVERFRPDVIVLDVGLPDRSGVEVFGDVASVYPDLPVLFSTGHADEARLQQTLSRPHVGFLRKPYPAEVLLEQIEQLTAVNR